MRASFRRDRRRPRWQRGPPCSAYLPSVGTGSSPCVQRVQVAELDNVGRVGVSCCTLCNSWPLAFVKDRLVTSSARCWPVGPCFPLICAMMRFLARLGLLAIVVAPSLAYTKSIRRFCVIFFKLGLLITRCVSLRRGCLTFNCLPVSIV